MKKQPKSLATRLSKQAKKIKVSAHLNSLEDAAFFKKKMEKGRKMLAEAGVPKPGRVSVSR